jgi:hypothetical protein
MDFGDPLADDEPAHELQLPCYGKGANIGRWRGMTAPIPFVTKKLSDIDSESA